MKITKLAHHFIENKNSNKLMIVLHGRGDSYEGFLWLPEALSLPFNYLMLNAPDDYFGGYSWYDLPPNQEVGVRRSAALLDDVLEEVLSSGYKPEDICVFGFSQGSLMSFEWGCRLEHALAGMVSLSGYILDIEKLLKETTTIGREMPRFVGHGRFDDVVPYENSRQQILQLEKEKYNLKFASYDIAHSIDPRQEIIDIQNFVKSIFPDL